MSSDADLSAFPNLTPTEFRLLKPLADVVEYEDGAVVFRAGTAEVDLFAVEEGAIEIRSPTANDALITTHHAGGFSGDIDLLTGRPVIVSGYARGATRVLRVPHRMIRTLLNRVPSFGEKLISAFTRRRELLSKVGRLGITVVGAGYCKDTNLVREFLHKNFVPFNWLNSETEAGQLALRAQKSDCPKPVVDCGGGQVLFNPTLRELAKCAGVWRPCPGELVDLAVVGGGPAGIAAAVYAASEGLSTLLLDRLGPGGQAGGSSKIENFIGFPAGLSGTELATRGVLQMLKFGARMVAPVAVERIEVPADPREPRLLHLDCNTVTRARVVLVATGVGWRKLPAVGAERFESAGIHYVCTAVEAVLYDESDVVVVGGGNSAGQATMHLAECCRTRRVHLVVRSPLGTGMSEYLVSRIRGAANVTVHEGAEVAEVDGAHHLESVVLAHAPSGTRERLACSGVFVFIGADPAARWLPPEVARDDSGYVLTGSDALRSGRWPLADRSPCPLETTVPGVLAAGDVRAGTTKRVGFAVGDGSLAVTCTHHLLSLR
ncbi:thioredoxin reductase : Response regulator receiver modulated FAD-dependent pyridine nucleotide-disulfide oxidoreductase OS=Rhodopirellula europaea SH398 GN=RESH_01920 PE=4 SV=1: cNMP_binding: Pyr_redox_2 [Gemmata massiliana]|uniref:Cyclic nucleotide-binding domain-containing protein n=1 Tax=Gemmata massiliana TaxID=1210884 RepID=A0A6P2CXL9_9BACT|nr:FAD-dependent oxidoreductase [Gemmata massiliana]VTR93116.1 thioredoxin reductase : Response regulator receiver modulated FAD-dependent pyridine nucleotide-disulfide oxidoreductase OS=Rhodopirellula europaea SH398 GN=RESH_01920 PE=4 SV=1: cNMP_binding: Pyr_redox_2 [Gemmata massiliana]